jgi:hypothetical protein
MSTWNLLHWVALIAGAELLARGHWLDRTSWLHAGAWLLATALVVAACRLHARRGAAALLVGLALLPVLLSGLRLADPTPLAPPEDPRLVFWKAHPDDRQRLDAGLDGEASEVELFGATIALDPQGTRATARTNASAPYRIVAVGGSATFGATRGPSERAWPALLELAIRRELACAVPVEVVNAGVLGRGIAGVVKGFETEILPLAPQLLLFEPGPGELDSLASELPDLQVAATVPVPPRASPLLRRLEESWRRHTAAQALLEARAQLPSEFDPRATTLAGAYRHLLIDARRHGIEVVLVSLALAIPLDAPEEAIRRAEALDPRTRTRLLALAWHQRVLAEMAATYRASLIDVTRDPLEGDGLFLDLHLRNQRGREQLVRTLLGGLGPKLANAPPDCHARAVESASATPH